MMIAGIDYSMSSPGLCIFDTEKQFSFKNCNLFGYTSAKKVPILENIKITPQKVYSSQEERFNQISDWCITLLKEHNVTLAAIEGYSYGSKSNRLFDIGENGGLLKHKMWAEGIKFSVPAPGELKKFYTGKGNANKDLMYEKFREFEKIDLGEKSDSPVSDLVDAFVICKFVLERKLTVVSS